VTVADIPENKDYEVVSDGELQIASVNEPVSLEELEADTDTTQEGEIEASSEESEEKSEDKE